MTRHKQIAGAAIGGGLVAAAVAAELWRRSRKRTWRDRVIAVVPLEFSKPALPRALSVR